MSQQAEVSVTRLNVPESQQSITIPITEPHMRLQLGFVPDPNAVEKNGQNLEFSFENGGKVVLEGYYDHFTGKTLPVMVTESGDELAGEDFLASLREDLLTAAGPGAGPGAGSGGAGEYADSAGDLITGVEGLEALGAGAGYDSARAASDMLFSAPEVPGGTFGDLSVITTLGAGTVVAGVPYGGLFEEGLANQHIGDPTVTPGQLVFTPILTGSTVVDAVYMQGFPAGMQVTIGEGAPITVTGPDQIITFTMADFTTGVYLIPPDNSDADMTITYSVDIRAASSGLTATIADLSFDIIVDAAADLPDVVQFGDQDLADAQFTWQEPQDPEAGGGGVRSTEAATVSIPVTATFTDLDGSEIHYIKIVGIPADWQVDADSLAALGLVEVPAPAAWAQYGGATPAADGAIKTYIFEVTDPAQGDVSGNIIFTPYDWTSALLADGSENTLGDAMVTVSAIAWEANLSGEELTLTNNYAENEAGTWQVHIEEDKPAFIQEYAGILSDETAGEQTAAEITALEGEYLLGVLSSLGLSTTEFFSAANTGVAYDLKSDGEEAAGYAADPASVSGSRLSIGFELTDGTDSGWKTTDGTPIYLFEGPNGSIIGSTDSNFDITTGTSDSIAFVVVASGQNGVAPTYDNGVNDATITFVQYMSLQHPTGGVSHDDELMASRLKLNLAVYDDEGDKAEIPVHISVRDDGPKISADSQDMSINVSETDLPWGTDPNGWWHVDNVSGNWGNEAKFRGHIDFSYGADGKADPAAAHTLNVNPFSWDDAALQGAGIQTYHPRTGALVAVRWVVSDDGLTLTGYAGDTNARVVLVKAELDANGASYRVTLTGPLFHEQDPENVAETGHTIDLLLNYTITDGDGDQASGKLTVTVKDDAPEVYYPTEESGQLPINVSETDLPGGTDPLHWVDNIKFNYGHEQNNYRGAIAFNYGADGPADPRVVDKDGNPKVVDENGDPIPPFTWTLPAEGKYQSIGADGRPENIEWSVVNNGLTLVGRNGEGDPVMIVHAKYAHNGPVLSGVSYDVYLTGALYNDKTEGWDDAIPVEFGFTVTDGDGDQASGDITVTVHDDAPIIAHCSQDVRINVSETDLPGGSDWHRFGNDVPGNVHDETLFVGQLVFTFGADGQVGPGMVDATGKAMLPFSWDTTTVEAKEYTAYNESGELVTITWVPDGLTVTGYAGTVEVITVTATLNDLGAKYVVDLKAPLNHPEAQHHTGWDHLPLGKGDTIDLPLGFTVTDGDGDQQTGALTVTVKDDLPCGGHCTLLEVESEAALRVGNKAMDGHGHLHVHFGADGPAASDPVKWNVDQIKTMLGEEGVEAIIGNKAYSDFVIEGSGTHITIWAMDGEGADANKVGDKPVMELVINGDYSYDYTQNYAIKHSNEFNVENFKKDLDFQYVVTDRDGDYATNTLQVTVIDSVLLPGGGAETVYETTGRDDGTVTATIALLLDYGSPDGLGAKWGDNPIFLDNLRAASDNSKLMAEVDETNPNLLVLKTDDGTRTVLTLELVQNPNGTWSIKYTQHEGLEHGQLPLHLDDLSLTMALSVKTYTVEGNSVENPVVITVVDDIPTVIGGSNLALLNVIGSNVLDAIKVLDYSSTENLAKSLVSAVKSLLTIDGTDIQGILSVFDLMLGTRFGEDGFEVTIIDFGGLGQYTDTIDWGKLLDPNPLISGPELIKVGLAFSQPVSANDHYLTEGKSTLTGDIHVNFGFDGPAAENEVSFSAKGVELALKLFGVHAAGNKNAWNVDVTHVDPGADLDKLEVRDGNTLLMTLTIVKNGAQYGFEVDIHSGLDHSPAWLESILGKIVGAGITSVGPALDDLLNQMLGTDDGNLLGKILTEILDGLKMTPSQLLDNLDILDNLGGGGLLTMYLPVVAEDADGDTAMSLVSVVVRDSVPELVSHTQPTDSVDEAGLALGDASDPTSVGSKYGEDGVNLTTNGHMIVKAFDGIGSFEINGVKVTITNGEATYKSEHGNLALVVTQVGETWRIEYTYTLEKAVTTDPATDNGTTPESETFAITVIDGDGDKLAAQTVTVKIADDVPVAISETDSLEAGAQDGSWLAEGSIFANGDMFGADGRAESGWLTVDGKVAAGDPEAAYTTWTKVDGDFGTLYINKDGGYRYETSDEKIREVMETDPTLGQKLVDVPWTEGLPDVTLGGVDPSTNPDGLEFAGYVVSITDAWEYVQGLVNQNFPDLQKAATVTQNNGGIGVDSGFWDGSSVGIGDLLVIDMPEGFAAKTFSLEFSNLGRPLGVPETVYVVAYGAEGNYIGYQKVEGVPRGNEGTNCTHDFSFTDDVAKILLTPMGDFYLAGVTVTSGTTQELRPDPDWKPQEDFSYILTDGDGDTSEVASLTIDVTAAAHDMVFVHTQDSVFNVEEKFGATDTATFILTAFSEDAVLDSVTFGDEKLTFEPTGTGAWTATDASIAALMGTVYDKISGATLVKQADGTYTLEVSYILTQGFDHTGKDATFTAEKFDITIGGKDIPVTVDITDAAPEFSNISTPANALASGAEYTGTFTLESLDGINWNTLSVVRDGVTVKSWQQGEGENTHLITVTLTDGATFVFDTELNASDEYTYTYTAPTTSGARGYTFSVQDSDGSVSTQLVTIKVNPQAVSEAKAAVEVPAHYETMDDVISLVDGKAFWENQPKGNTTSFTIGESGSNAATSFDWSFTGKTLWGSKDKAEWVLKKVGADGEVVEVDRDVLHEGGNKNGTQPISGLAPGEYQLFFIVDDNTLGDSTTLTVSNITYWAPTIHTVTGDRNVLANEHKLETDLALSSVTVDGVTQSFSDTVTELTFKSEVEGETYTLTINANGTYTYTGETGNLDVGYTVVGNDDLTDTATLHIRPEGVGDAQIIFEGDGSLIVGNDLDNVIFGDGSNNTIGGDQGNDIIYGGDGNDAIFGGAGNDIMYGGLGNDTLHGEWEDDTIAGGQGNDIMYGGDGTDLFVWKEGDLDGGGDYIKDFQLGKDFLRFESLLTDGEDLDLSDISNLVGNDTFALSATSANDLKLTVDAGSKGTVTVDIHLVEGSITNWDSLGNSETTQAELLQQLIITNSGG